LRFFPDQSEPPDAAFSSASEACHGERLQNQNGPLRQKQAALGFNPKVLFGGAREDRTPDLLNAIQALSHLSYDPTGERHRGVAVAMRAI
jgi:hypothetical protein